ncbi:hypothetical protein ACLBYD_00780 [Rhodococcus sp. C26F]|uniref:Uncharacterized protein n=1 Tax=Rhodococcus pyridinivorans SB3094 TaxID=1435356 RepID=V9XN69_9NOCA|nr:MULTISPECIES: hypothetical protein [Rhodococcus]AHD23848.1 hypothetical protein Y013_17045 [Rhodococcus pyridinivorans SB3094]MCT7291555.1 hypothetical protein [Rhodococcus sp. PAE-6]
MPNYETRQNENRHPHPHPSVGFLQLFMEARTRTEQTTPRAQGGKA